MDYNPHNRPSRALVEDTSTHTFQRPEPGLWARIYTHLLWAGAWLSPQLARGIEHPMPYPLTESILMQSFSRLEIAQSEVTFDTLQELVEELWLPNTDIVYMARAIAEGSFEQASPTEQAEFMHALSQYIGLSYQMVLGQYQAGQRCHITPAESPKRGSRVGVKVQLVDATRTHPLTMSLHWKYSEATAHWGLYDLSIDGHSVLIQPKKREWAPILKAQGLPGLTSYLTREIKALTTVL